MKMGKNIYLFFKRKRRKKRGESEFTKVYTTKARDLSHRDEAENGFEPSRQGAKH
jgi:hypothetical protein